MKKRLGLNNYNKPEAHKVDIAVVRNKPMPTSANCPDKTFSDCPDKSAPCPLTLTSTLFNIS